MINASLIILNRDSYTLLGRKKCGDIGKGTFNAAGGKVHPGESLLACAIREALEELGIQLTERELIHIATITFFSAGIPTFRVVVFRSDTFTGEPSESAEMIPAWFKQTELPLAEMLEGDRTWFPQAVAGEKFCAEVRYAGGVTGFLGTTFLPYDPNY